MFLTVIVPVYNVRDYLASCLDSVSAVAARFSNDSVATDKSVEVLFVDDGSTDGSGDELDRLSKQTDLPSGLMVSVIHQKNAGVSAARNAGLARATGEWVTFLDADDTWHPDVIVRAAKHIRQYPSIDAYIFTMRYIDDKGVLVKDLFLLPSRLMSADDLLSSACGVYGCYLYGASNKFYRRSLIEKMSLRFRLGMKLAEDSLFTHVFLCQAGDVFVDSEFGGYNYLMRHGSATHSKQDKLDLHDLIFFEALYLQRKKRNLPGVTLRMTQIALGCVMLGCETPTRSWRRDAVRILLDSKVFNRQVMPFLLCRGRTLRQHLIGLIYCISPFFLRKKILENL